MDLKARLRGYISSDFERQSYASQRSNDQNENTSPSVKQGEGILLYKKNMNLPRKDISGADLSEASLSSKKSQFNTNGYSMGNTEGARIKPHNPIVIPQNKIVFKKKQGGIFNCFRQAGSEEEILFSDSNNPSTR